MWFTTCTCAKDRPEELKAAQEKWDREQVSQTDTGTVDGCTQHDWYDNDESSGDELSDHPGNPSNYGDST
jgi:hypothetical protein